MEKRPIVRLKRTLTKENEWLYVLSLLKKRGRCYAYGMQNEIENNFGWKPSLITTYIVLYMLEREGLIRSEYDGRRKYYKITTEGLKTLEIGKDILKKTAESI
ncbi:MAG: PadR family transcriptional regulator [Candidatus Micrarchaeia archaeon]